MDEKLKAILKESGEKEGLDDIRSFEEYLELLMKFIL